MKTNFNELPEFSKEVKQFSKKYKSLFDDLEKFKQVVDIIPLGNTKHFNIITQTHGCTVVKARLFCKYLKGASFRIIYAFHSQSCKVDFIELYFKGEKENEDRERINNYLTRS